MFQLKMVVMRRRCFSLLPPFRNKGHQTEEMGIDNEGCKFILNSKYKLSQTPEPGTHARIDTHYAFCLLNFNERFFF